MTTEQQRIAIAEACGWKRIPADNVGAAARLFYGDVWWRDAENNTIASVEQLPDYLNDLDAMHEAEKLIYEHKIYDMRERYLRNLAELLTNEIASDLETYEGSPHFENIFLVAHATAHQRAEAFLKTLNLYKKP